MSSAAPTTGQTLIWNGTAWVARDLFTAADLTKADTADPGVLLLAGDLAGTSTAPTLPGKADIDDPRFPGADAMTAALSAVWA